MIELEPEVLPGIMAAANPRSLAGRLDDLLSAAPNVVESILRSPTMRPIFLPVVGGSRSLFSTLTRSPDLLASMFIHNGIMARKTRNDKEEELRKLLDETTSTAAMDRVIRFYKEVEYLRIGGRDLADLADVREVMAELSDLAGACLQAAIEAHWRRLVEKHGRPPVPENHLGLFVLGMGKLSGGELNFSSDIDLIFIREPEEGNTAGPRPVSVAQFYESLVQAVTKALSQVTEDGFAFRIDLRLRPEGDKGELAPSGVNALDYYFGWGRTWERAALMKAVCIAGDRDVGREFLRDLEPFIFRKYLDYSTLDEMRNMKAQIERGLKRKPGINIKLGQGGIREIEFFVQALQLINAGRTRRVRTASTLEALDLLREADLLEKAVADQLRDAYLFFRRTEHRIQINHQLQTHELPRTEDDQAELARRMGFHGPTALQDFRTRLDAYRKTVEELFAGLFYHAGDAPAPEVSEETLKLVECADKADTADVDCLPHGVGFDDPATAVRMVRNILHSSENEALPEKAQALLHKLIPLFLEEMLKQPEPSKALPALYDYLASLHAHSAYFSTLLENPPTIRFIAQILGESRFFSDLLIRHPQAIDSLIAKGSADYHRSKQELDARLVERITYCEEFEEELDVLRRFRNEEMLVIGVHHLAGDLDSPTARRLVTNLAEACLNGAVDIALREMRRKFGSQDVFESLPFVILGMGKLGGSEMSYLSDVDVIFIYDSPAESIGRFSSHEWFSRFAGRIISALSIPTGEGAAWAIDTRLRPSGNKGPLVSSIESFRGYHRTSSQLWEKQALIKARPITGPPELTEAIQDVIRECVTATVYTPDVPAEIARVRNRMEQELAMEDRTHVDLKTGHGGLVDIEFFVQANILRYAAEFPEILRPNTVEALRTLWDHGLITADAYETLDTGYRFLTNLEDRLRIMEHKSIDRLPLEGDKLKSLARRLGYKEGREVMLVEDYQRITRAIRRVYDSCFATQSS